MSPTATDNPLRLCRGSIELTLARLRESKISALLNSPKRGGLAWATAETSACRITTEGSSAVWIGDAAFDLKPGEVRRVREFLDRVAASAAA